MSLLKKQQSPYLLVTTKKEDVLTNKFLDVSSIKTTDQDEADTRIILHLWHAVENGHTAAYVRTVDSDIVVLCIHFFPKLQGLLELWVGYGKGKHFSVLPIHQICQQLSPQVCKAILFFHAYTGSDLTSSFKDIGKKTAWNAWTNDNAVTETMVELTTNPQMFKEDSAHMQILEKFTVRLYSKDSSINTINDARRHMFTQKLMSLERIPPTQAALFQHVKRTLLVSSFIWGKCLNREINLPSPNEYGWEWNERLKIWMPFWTTLKDVSSACSMLLHCSCLKACKGNCKCFKNSLRCTPLCRCEGGCLNTEP